MPPAKRIADYSRGDGKDKGATDEQADEIYDTYMQRFMRGEISEETCWDEPRQNYGLVVPDDVSEEFKNWRGLVKNDVVVVLIEKARAAGLQVALLTNVIEPTYNVLPEAGNYDHFDEVIASCKVGYAKPQKEIYQLALDKLHTTAEQSLFIDDKQKSLDPAIAMGFATIPATSPEQIIRDATTSALHDRWKKIQPNTASSAWRPEGPGVLPYA